MKKQNKAEGAPAQSAAPMAPKPRKKHKHLVRILIALGVVLALLVLFVVPKLFQKPVYPSVNVAAAAKGDVQTSLDTSGIVKSEEVKTYFSVSYTHLGWRNREPDIGRLIKKEAARPE